MASRINPLLSYFLRHRSSAGPEASLTTNRLAKMVDRHRANSDITGPTGPNVMGLDPATRPLYDPSVYQCTLEELTTHAAAFLTEKDEEQITRLVESGKSGSLLSMRSNRSKGAD